MTINENFTKKNPIERMDVKYLNEMLNILEKKEMTSNEDPIMILKKINRIMECIVANPDSILYSWDQFVIMINNCISILREEPKNWHQLKTRREIEGVFFTIRFV